MNRADFPAKNRLKLKTAIGYWFLPPCSKQGIIHTQTAINDLLESKATLHVPSPNPFAKYVRQIRLFT